MAAAINTAISNTSGTSSNKKVSLSASGVSEATDALQEEKKEIQNSNTGTAAKKAVSTGAGNSSSRFSDALKYSNPTSSTPSTPSSPSSPMPPTGGGAGGAMGGGAGAGAAPRSGGGGGGSQGGGGGGGCQGGPGSGGNVSNPWNNSVDLKSFDPKSASFKGETVLDPNNPATKGLYDKLEAALNGKNSGILNFSDLTNCGPCKTMKPIVDQASKDGVNIKKFDLSNPTEKQQGNELISDLKKQGVDTKGVVPAFVGFYRDKEGRIHIERNAKTGMTTAENLKGMQNKLDKEKGTVDKQIDENNKKDQETTTPSEKQTPTPSDSSKLPEFPKSLADNNNAKDLHKGLTDSIYCKGESCYRPGEFANKLENDSKGFLLATDSNGTLHAFKTEDEYKEAKTEAAKTDLTLDPFVEMKFSNVTEIKPADGKDATYEDFKRYLEEQQKQPPPQE